MERTHKRIYINSEAEVSVLGVGEKIPLTLTSLSRSGMGFRTMTVRMPKGAIVQVEIDEETFYGEVVWSNETGFGICLMEEAEVYPKFMEHLDKKHD